MNNFFKYWVMGCGIVSLIWLSSRLATYIEHDLNRPLYINQCIHDGHLKYECEALLSNY